MSAVYEPAITAVSLAPNPAAINGSIVLRVTVTEVIVTMYAVSAICGTAICGATPITISKEAV